jgi:hypothetical protein
VGSAHFGQFTMYLKREHAEQYDAIVECSAFVNWRRIERGLPPVLALSFTM